MRKFVVLNWVIVTTAVLYMFGTLAVKQQSEFLQTARLPSAGTYEDILVQGFWVFTSLPLNAMSFPLELPWVLLILVVVLVVVLFRLGISPRAMWGVFGITFLFCAFMDQQLQNGGRSSNPLLLSPRPTFFFGAWFPAFYDLWALLLLVTFRWLYVREFSMRVMWVARAFGLIWFLIQAATFAKVTGAYSLLQSGVPEIAFLESPQPSLGLNNARVFLLGQTADTTRYALLTITKATLPQRAVVVVRKEQLQTFTIVGQMDVFHNPVRTIK